MTFTGNASGAIVITMTNGSGGRAMYIKSITVTYTAGSVPSGPKYYHKMTSLDELEAGKKYLIVYEQDHKFLGDIAQNSAYGIAVNGPVISGNQVDIDGYNDIRELTLSLDSYNYLSLNNGNGYLCYNSSDGSNPLNVQSSIDNHSKWRAVADNGGFILQNVSATRRYIQYDSSLPGFSSYQSTQENAYLYVEGEAPVVEACISPTFSPDGGIFTGSVDVTITSATEGATIYYTTDGSEPVVSRSSIANGGIVTLTESCTLKAMAVKDGYENSPIVSSNSYTISSGSGSSSTIYRKVTSTEDLVAGHKYIVVYENGSSSVGMGAYDNSKHFNASQTLSISNDNKVDIANKDVLELTLGGEAGAWTLYTGSGYIQGSDAVEFKIVSDPSNNNAKWVITNSVDGEDDINGFVVKNSLYTRFIKTFTNNSNVITFRHYGIRDGAWAYLYVQNNAATIHAEPNPLNIFDNNEAGGKTGSFTVTGENLGTDDHGVGVNLVYGNFSRITDGGQPDDWGFYNADGTVSGTVTVNYEGCALSSKGQISLGHSLTSTLVDVNYLYTGPIYVIGDVNNYYWNTSNGAQMTRDENGVYSTTVSVQQSSDAGYISFTKQLGSNYAAGQFGPVSSGNWWYNDGLNGIYQPIDTLGNVHNIRIEPGTYTIYVNPATNQFMIERYVITVTISPEDGTTFTGSTISGTITDSPAGTIEWSTDGTNWQTYTDGFTLTANQVGDFVTVYARSTSNGVTCNPVSATYQRVLAPAPEPPVFSRPGGDVAAGTVVTITAPEGCTLYVDGQQVNSPYEVTINEATTISAYCVNNENTPSETVSYTFNISTVCEAEIEFKNNDTDSSVDITANSIQGYYEKGEDFISSVSGINKVFKGKTGLKFSSGSDNGTITFNLDDEFVDSWKVAHIILNAKQYGSDNATLTVTTSTGESHTTPALTASLVNYSLDFNGDEIEYITISANNRAYLQGFTIVYDCAAPVAQTATLADIESSVEQGKLVLVEDELIGTWAVDNPVTGDKLLWAKDQGNLSIDKRPGKTDTQRDYVKDILKYEWQETWDESNWVILDFGGIEGDPFEFVGHKIKAGTVNGIYVNDENYKIQLTEKPSLTNGNPYLQDAPEYPGWVEPFPEDKLGTDYDLAYNSFVPANFMTENHNRLENGEVVGGFVAPITALYDHAGDSLYFINPKIQEVAHIWAVWNGGDEDIFTVYLTEHKENENINAWSLNGTFKVDWTYNCKSTDYDVNTNLEYGRPENLVPNMAYEFHAAIMRPGTSKRGDVEPQGTANPGTPSPDYMAYPLDMSDAGTPTAVIELNGLKTVVSISYYNLMGIESNKPFEGINIVVTRYSDGNISTVKILR